MIYATSNSFVTVWRGEYKDNYSEFSISSSRKDRKTDEYINSNFSYVRFVGKAFDKSKELKERDRITNITFGLTLEPYMKDGEKVYPKGVRITIYDFEMAEPLHSSGAKISGKPHSEPYAAVDSYDPDEDDDGELPF